jgi:catechol-2,3-dioxygenase
MSNKPRLVGIELYFEDLPSARNFYKDTLGLKLLQESRAITPSLKANRPFSAWSGKASNPILRRIRR